MRATSLPALGAVLLVGMVALSPAAADAGGGSGVAEALSPGRCLTGGNVVDYQVLYADGTSSGRIRIDASTPGIWSASFGGLAATAVGTVRPGGEQILLQILEAAGVNRSFAFTADHIVPGQALSALTNEDETGVSRTCGRGRFLVHDLSLGASEGAGRQSLRKLTVSWDMSCNLERGSATVLATVQGCAHYESAP